MVLFARDGEHRHGHSLEGPFGEASIGVSMRLGGDGVRGDAVSGAFQRQGAGEPDDAGLVKVYRGTRTHCTDPGPSPELPRVLARS